jgi:hypothetical protein
MRNINKIAVFDFDGTLINTQLPETGKIEYEKKTGKPWPHQGWWGRPESLDLGIFDMPIIKSVEIDYIREKSNQKTLLVLLTGRMKKLEPEVLKVLEKYNLVFDEYYFNTGGSTDVFKVKILTELANRYPHCAFELWEDRHEHIPIFENWGKDAVLAGKITDFNINVIYSGHH